jgi:hypothetical protein
MAYGLLLWISMVTVIVVPVSVARRSIAGRQSLDHALAFSQTESCARIAPPVNEVYTRGFTDASIHAHMLGTYQVVAFFLLLTRRSTTFICCYLHLRCLQRAHRSSAGMHTLLTKCWQLRRIYYSVHRLRSIYKYHGSSVSSGSLNSCFSASGILRDLSASLRVNLSMLPKHLSMHASRDMTIVDAQRHASHCLLVKSKQA